MITIVIGAQYGGEGKGKITAALYKNRRYSIVCRCGGINSSHTIVNDTREYRFRMLPTSVSVDLNHKIVFGAGSLIHIPTLFKEMNDWGVSNNKVMIDRNAGIIDDDSIAAQRADTRYEKIGSTLTGTGYATSKRSLRKLKLASEYDEIRDMISDTSQYLFQRLSRRENILVEGHQGSMLSNYHGDYPYVSSRDSIAAAMLSELGLGLDYKFEVVLVVKTFETRNHSGSLNNEIAPETAAKMGIIERGGGSWEIPDRVRRVGMIDPNTIKKAMELNTPKMIAITGGDYLKPSLRENRSINEENRIAVEEIVQMFSEYSSKISMISTGRHTNDIILLDEKSKNRKKSLIESQSLLPFETNQNP